MRAAELLTLAAAHGIDLKRLAGNATDDRGIARKRRRSRREIKLGMDVLETAQGVESRIGKPPAWSVAEIGIAACSVPRMPWLSALYSFACDYTHYKELHRGLMLRCIKLATEENWPMRVIDRNGDPQFYYAELAALVLDADAHKSYFIAAPALYAVYMGTSDEVWHVVLASRFLALQYQYERWLATARGMIQKWLNADEPSLEVA
jgi:hypothetical protein